MGERADDLVHLRHGLHLPDGGAQHPGAARLPQFQDINWLIGAVTGILLLVGLLLASTTVFQAGFDPYAAAAGYPTTRQTLNLAADGGMPTGITLTDTLGIIPIIWLISLASTYMGGEVRTRRRRSFARPSAGCSSMRGSRCVLFFAISGAVTVDFNQALAWLATTRRPNDRPGVSVFMLYAGVLIDNLPSSCRRAGLVAVSYLWLPSAMIIATRAMSPGRSTGSPGKGVRGPSQVQLAVGRRSSCRGHRRVVPHPLSHRRLQVPDPGPRLLLRLLARIAVRAPLPVHGADPAVVRGQHRELAGGRASRSCRSAAWSGCSTSASGCTSC